MAGSEVFGDLFWFWIQKRGLKQSEFAKKAGKSAGVIQYIRQGKRSPPTNKFQDWADILSLTGEDRERFILMATMAHLPKAVQPAFTKHVEDHLRLKRNYRDLRDELANRT